MRVAGRQKLFITLVPPPATDCPDVAGQQGRVGSDNSYSGIPISSSRLTTSSAQPLWKRAISAQSMIASSWATTVAELIPFVDGFQVVTPG